MSIEPLFYTGTHMPTWLNRAGVPLFISHRRLMRQQTWPQAGTPWALDSGAFSEIALFGQFTTSPTDYVAAVRRYRDQIGKLQWAAPQDHMCEPWMLARSTIAHTVDDAQRWTVDNYLTLRTLAPELPFIPVLQGQTLADYRRHADAYQSAGVHLSNEPLVGVGSICRRQATGEIANLIAALHGDGLRLHGFGIKTSGLYRYGWCLASADSMAWSYRGRHINPCPHTGAVSCANCLPHAQQWRRNVLRQLSGQRPVQLVMSELLG